MNAPSKPFPGYKWRWAVLTPTESLNDPVVFHGVLRVLAENEGMPPNSERVIGLLRVLQRETKTSVNLARTPARNLVRNSGQYWKALDLLGDLSGEIALTDFGRRVAGGGITKTEFAMTVIKTLELPNRRIEQDTLEWDRAGLKIKPLELILQILGGLQESLGGEQAYVTPFELVHIVIPLAGVQAPVTQHVEALRLYRRGALDLTGWPDCAPEANDRRMAREFLLFLANYGLCTRSDEAPRENERFVLPEPLYSDLEQFGRLNLTGEEPASAVRRVRETNLPSVADRERVLAEVTARPYQSVFRNNVLAAYNSKCLITDVVLEAVLEAVHIVPVSRGGNDRIENGVCLRSDIHLLYDSGHLRINTSGSVHLSEVASQSSNYGSLPRKIAIPQFVNIQNVGWRWKYY
jgi:hypothetical protein